MLTQKEKDQTAQELQRNYQCLRKSEEQVLEDLQWNKETLEKALHVQAHPSDVWKLRDYLEEKIVEQGDRPIPFTVLRPERNHWFTYTRTW